MDTLRIDILNPKAKKLLEDLEDLNLISIKKDDKEQFEELAAKLGSKTNSAPSVDEITKEVEEVRARRYGN